MEMTSNEDREICAKVNNTETDDHISELPDDVLSFILSFLNMRSAVRARVLSWRWRYVNASASNLEFDIFNIFGIKCERATEYNLWKDKLRFIRAVDHFLQLYRNSNISSFKVNYCLGKESACHIDKWVSFAVRMETEKLELNFSLIPRNCELYSFPCRLLPQGTVSSLKHLCLNSCKLEPSNSTNSFNSLKTLELCSVSLDQSALYSILSGCINVESLKLDNCILPDTVSIHGRECVSLRRLIMFDCHVFNNDHGVLKVEFCSIDLKIFEYMGAVPRLSYVDVTSLEKLYLCFTSCPESRMNDVVSGHAKDHPHLQTLSLFFRTLMLKPTGITQFSHLKELELIVVQASDFDHLSIVFVLNASPCLQKLHLALYCYGPRSLIARTEFDTSQPFCCHQLKQVKITGFRIKTDASELARYLLSNAVGLERMIITKNIERYFAGGKWKSTDIVMEESDKKWIHNFLSMEKVNPEVELIIQ